MKQTNPFWSRVQRTATCWFWSGYCDRDGYGRVRFRGRMVGAHRVAWILTYGDIAIGMHILHRCDTPRCCRPDHLFIGTNADNVSDRHAKGRSKNLFRSSPDHHARLRSGQNHWAAKLTDYDVIKLRAMRANGAKLIDIAACFNINHGTASRISRGIWR